LAEERIQLLSLLIAPLHALPARHFTALVFLSPALAPFRLVKMRFKADFPTMISQKYLYLVFGAGFYPYILYLSKCFASISAYTIGHSFYACYTPFFDNTTPFMAIYSLKNKSK